MSDSTVGSSAPLPLPSNRSDAPLHLSSTRTSLPHVPSFPLELITCILFQTDCQTREDFTWLWKTCRRVSPEFRYAALYALKSLVPMTALRIMVIDPNPDVRLDLVYNFDPLSASRFRCTNWDATSLLMKRLLNHVLAEKLSALVHTSTGGPSSSSSKPMPLRMPSPLLSQSGGSLQPIIRVAVYLLAPSTDTNLEVARDSNSSSDLPFSSNRLTSTSTSSDLLVNAEFLGFISPSHLRRIALQASNAGMFLSIDPDTDFADNNPGSAHISEPHSQPRPQLPSQLDSNSSERREHINKILIDCFNLDNMEYEMQFKTEKKIVKETYWKPEAHERVCAEVNCKECIILSTPEFD